MPKPVAVLSPKITEELEGRNSQETDVENIWQDREYLDWLLKVTTEHEHWLKIDMDYFDHLRNYSQVVYLFDFDVLRQYLEGSDPELDQDVADPESDQNFAVFHLFLDSKLRYAFPAGACIELFHWLNKEILTTRTMALLGNLTKQQFLTRCAQLLRIKDADTMDEEEALDEISQQIDKKAQVVDRLIRVLDSDRFEGMVVASDPQCERVIQEILADIPRGRRRGNREVLDECDALNLSIAITSVRAAIATKKMKNSTDKPSIYLLVSQTGAIFQVAKHLGSGRAVPEFVREFEALLKRSPKETKAFLPVISPRHAFRLIEVFDLFGNHWGAYNSISYLKGKFNEASHHLFNARSMIEYWEQEETGAGRNQVVRADIQANIRVALQNLEGIAGRMLSNEPRLGLLEQERAQSISDHYARKEMEGHEAVGREEKARQKSVNFMKLLSQLLISLDRASGVHYRCLIEPRDDNRPFEKFTIVQLLEGTGGEPEEIATGEIYYSNSNNGGVPLYYAIRWPIACLEDDFLESLSSIFIPEHVPTGGLRDEQGPISLEALTAKSEYWDEGVMIYTTQGVFGCSLAPFFATNTGWFHLRYRQLYEQFNSSHVQAGRNKVVEESIQPFSLLQYRVNSHYGDFLFDIEPSEGEADRYLTIISDYNLSKYIIAMFNHTGMHCAIPKKLEKELSAKLSAFPDLDEKGEP